MNPTHLIVIALLLFLFFVFVVTIGWVLWRLINGSFEPKFAPTASWRVVQINSEFRAHVMTTKGKWNELMAPMLDGVPMIYPTRERAEEAAKAFIARESQNDGKMQIVSSS